MMHVGNRIVFLVTLLAGCAAAGASGPQSGTAPAAESFPRVDHHLHLMGPAIAAIVDGEPMLPGIALPPELGKLLDDRSAAWNDRAGLERVYAADAVLLGDQRRGWIRGGGEAAAYMSRRFRSAYRLLPVDHRRSGEVAHLSGYYVRGDGGAIQHVGYFSIVAKVEGGRWRIVSEMPRFPVAPPAETVTAEAIVARLDRTGVRRAAILSEAFWADAPTFAVSDAYAKVMAENDWTADQVRRFPDRLVAFCSFNPVADHALRELERCAANPVFRGLKFSFAMSGVDLKKPDHEARVRQVFEAANRRKLAIVAHLRSGESYGREDASIFLDRILPAAPDIVVQIAHLWGGERFSDEALSAYAEAVAAGRPATRNLYFDVAEVWADVSGTGDPATQRILADRMRQIGFDRIVFGTDGRVDAAQAWRLFKATVPLTPEEFRAIAENRAPYAR